MWPFVSVQRRLWLFKQEQLHRQNGGNEEIRLINDARGAGCTLLTVMAGKNFMSYSNNTALEGLLIVFYKTKAI